MFRESMGGICLFSGHLIIVIDLDGESLMGVVLFNLISSFMMLVLFIC